MDSPELPIDGRRSFPLHAQLRIKNGYLAAAAKKAGGVKSLAEKLGIRTTTLYGWCAMTGCPPEKPTQFWPAERLEKLEANLLGLTGALLQDIFPPEVRERVRMKSGPMAFERQVEVETEALNFIGASQMQRLIAPDPSRVAEDSEHGDRLKSAIDGLLHTLSYREQQILKMRFGLDGNESWTYDEIASVFKVTKERIRQIEMKAIRKMMLPSRSAELVGFLD